MNEICSVLGFAIAHDFNKAFNVVMLTAFAWAMILYYKLITPLLIAQFRSIQPTVSHIFAKLWNNTLIRIAFYSVIVAAIAAFLILDTATSRHRLVGLCGMAFFFVFMFIFSRSPTKVYSSYIFARYFFCKFQIRWRPVIWGFFLQFCFGLLVLRWEFGSRKFNQLSDLVLTFMDFTKNGTDFVYGFLSKN